MRRNRSKLSLAPRATANSLFLTFVFLILNSGSICAAFPTVQESITEVLPADEANHVVDFDQQIRPILAKKCMSCHGPGDAQSGLRLDQRDLALGDTDSGRPAIVPGDTDGSELLYRIAAEEGERMPPEGEPLSVEQVALLQAWIEQGANWPEHWAYRELNEVTPPTLDERAQQQQQSETGNFESWPRNNIDHFVLKRLIESGMHPSPEADKRVLIRRIYFDLIGLPPTPEEVEAFLSDTSPQAYETIVDRLLESPRYGERWARHWMDVVHYADSHGFEHDVARESWPYRDYLIQSLNEDKPYDRFVKEQIAGDSLYPGDPDALVATAFLATGPWDMSGIQAGNPESMNYQVSMSLDRDDIVTTVVSTLVSSTVHCARCHDHKFDPITQRDYYGLQAVFAGIDKAHRFYDPDPTVAMKRQMLLAEQRELPDLIANKNPRLLADNIQRLVEAWASKRQNLSSNWVIPSFIEFSSSEGTKLNAQEDGSYLVEGNRPEVDLYTARFKNELQQVTAIRLELLTDESLPVHGPGRAENGNLHLNEFVVKVVSDNDHSVERTISIKKAVADFNQSGWTIEHAIDGVPASAWGIYPEVSKPHQAVFVLSEPVTLEDGFHVAIEVHQQHGAGHIIGRPRLSITNTLPDELDQTLSGPTLSIELAKIMSSNPSEWSEEDRFTLAAHYLRERIESELGSLPAQQQVYCGTNEFIGNAGHQPAAVPRTIHVLRRGDVSQPMEIALPGALSCLPNLEPRFAVDLLGDESVRRVALANWLTDDNNVLLWRSIVNRIWHYHFGMGIVDTPSDFGRMGSAPSHPQLLDWLAHEFRNGDRSLKSLHRLIVTSATYRQASTDVPEFAARDNNNRLLWRMNRKRLDAESIRDSILYAAGTLDFKMGGPPFRNFVDGVKLGARAEANYIDFDLKMGEANRRSIYRYHYRTMPDPLMSALDCPSGETLMPTRTESITALQALAVMNDRLVIYQSTKLAERLKSISGDSELQIVNAYQLLFGRNPTAQELQAVLDYRNVHGLANACRMLINTNEMMFLD